MKIILSFSWLLLVLVLIIRKMRYSADNSYLSLLFYYAPKIRTKKEGPLFLFWMLLSLLYFIPLFVGLNILDGTVINIAVGILAACLSGVVFWAIDITKILRKVPKLDNKTLPIVLKEFENKAELEKIKTAYENYPSEELSITDKALLYYLTGYGTKAAELIDEEMSGISIPKYKVMRLDIIKENMGALFPKFVSKYPERESIVQSILASDNSPEEAVLFIEDADSLKQIALTHPSVEVRKAALFRIEDESFLSGLLKNDPQLAKEFEVQKNTTVLGISKQTSFSISLDTGEIELLTEVGLKIEEAAASINGLDDEFGRKDRVLEEFKLWLYGFQRVIKSEIAGRVINSINGSASSSQDNVTKLKDLLSKGQKHMVFTSIELNILNDFDAEIIIRIDWGEK